MAQSPIKSVNEYLFGGWELTLLGIGLLNIYIALGLYASAHFSFLAFGISWFFGWGVVLRLFYRSLRVGFALSNNFLSKRKRLKDLQLAE